MNENDRNLYRARYVERLDKFGHDPRTLGWKAGKQHERFAILTGCAPLGRIGSVLDVGCGFGDLFWFLRDAGFVGRYTGIDFVPELIERGRRAYPDADLRVADIDSLDETGGYDLVVASGIFNARLKDEDNWERIDRTLRRMFSISNIAAASDFLTSYVDFTEDDLYYTSPEQIFELSKSLTRRVTLRHDYMPFEFAVHLFKDDRVVPQSRFHPIGHG